MNQDHVDVAVSGALITTTLAIVLSAYWRQLKRKFAGFTWAPRVTPGIKAEVIMVMSASGHVVVQFDKIAPEDDVSAVFGQLTDQWFRVGAQMGVHCDWTSKLGQVHETPEGPEYIVALVRPEVPAVRVVDTLVSA